MLRLRSAQVYDFGFTIDDMMYWISGLQAGRLTTMPKPNGGSLLPDAVRNWKANGVDVVVSALTAVETQTAQLQNEAALCQQLGLRFHSFPIADYGVPEDETAVLALVTQLSDYLNQGLGVAIHCWGGIGRSTVLAAAVLIQQGFDPETVFDSVGAARGTAVPDTQAQKEWVWALAASKGTEM